MFQIFWLTGKYEWAEGYTYFHYRIANNDFELIFSIFYINSKHLFVVYLLTFN